MSWSQSFLLWIYGSSYPTTWGDVSGKPSFVVDANHESWKTGSVVSITTSESASINGDGVYISSSSDMEISAAKTSNIKISDKATGGNLKDLTDYPIKWSVISQKPSYLYTNENDISFGQYSNVSYDSSSISYSGKIYPALRICDYYSNPQGNNYTYTCYYFNGSSWVKFNNSNFTPKA